MSIKLERTGPAPSSAGQQLERVDERDKAQAIWRGMSHKCPACGTGALYSRYLKVADHCPDCRQALHHHRADDAPPYFTIFIVGHFALAGVLSLEQAYRPSPWLHVAIWLPLIVISSLWMLPRAKGAFVGLQWALRMHGFGNDADSVIDVSDNKHAAASNAPPAASIGPNLRK